MSSLSTEEGPPSSLCRERTHCYSQCQLKKKRPKLNKVLSDVCSREHNIPFIRFILGSRDPGVSVLRAFLGEERGQLGVQGESTLLSLAAAAAAAAAAVVSAAPNAIHIVDEVSGWMSEALPQRYDSTAALAHNAQTA